MNDRELLAMAAKAAGYAIEQHQNAKVFSGLYFSLKGETWNHLTDDGDNLRLAVKCVIDIRFADCADDSPIVICGTGAIELAEGMAPDFYAATRRAIVRAAAEIGKAMP